jgi:hypothetical protein
MYMEEVDVVKLLPHPMLATKCTLETTKGWLSYIQQDLVAYQRALVDSKKSYLNLSLSVDQALMAFRNYTNNSVSDKCNELKILLIECDVSLGVLENTPNFLSEALCTPNKLE